MRRALATVSALLCLLALAGCSRLAPPTPTVEPSWTTLFDGRTLTGWKASENPASFTVRDGMIIVHGQRAHLFYVGSGTLAPAFQDFELKAEVFTLPGATSGLFIHTAYQDQGWPTQGIEVQINNTSPADPMRTGSLSNLATLDRSPVADGVWWEMHVTVRGKRLSVKLNGQVVVDYHEPPERASEPRLGAGTFALQAHDPGSEVRFRNLRILPLAEGASAAPAGSSPALTTPAPALADLFQQLAAFAGGGPCQAITAVEDLLAKAAPEEHADFETRLLAVLASPSTTAAGRQVACRLLQRVGSDACVPTLAGLLADPELSPPACGVLERLDSPAARRALREALENLTGPQQLGVLHSLGNSHDPESVPRLIDLAGTPDAALAEAALQALGEIGGMPAMTALQEARSAAPSERRDQVTRALLRALEQTDSTTDPDAVAAAYHALYAAREPLLVRVAAFAGWVRLEGERAAPLILRTLEDPAPELQGLAAHYIRTLKGADLTAACAARLSQADAAVQVALLAALAERGDRLAKPAVLAALQRPELQVREAAAAALEKLGSAAEIEPLALAAAKASGPEHDTLCASLSRLPGDEVGPALLKTLAHAHPGVRRAAIRALTLRREPGAGLRVIAAGNDPDANVRLEACAALPDLVEVSSLPRLVGLLARAPTDADREAVRAALTEIGARAATPDRAAEVLAAALQTATAPAVRSALLRSLSQLGGPTALGAVQEALDDHDATRADERKAILASLAMAPDPRAGEIISASLGDAAVQTAAATALLTLARRLLGLDLAQARDFALRAQKACPADSVQRQAEALLKLTSGMAAYLTSWQLAGPYTGVPREALFTAVFPPEEGKDQPGDWKPLPVGTQPDKPWLLDLQQALGGDDRAAYLRTFLYAPRELQARLDLGSNDGVKVWLNGQPVHANPAWRELKPGEDELPITLLPGWNTLLLKVVQGDGEWGACARLVAPDGKPLEGVTAKATPSAVGR